jgi:hypothetical protein
MESASRLGPFLKRKMGAVSHLKKLQFDKPQSNSLVHSDHGWRGKLMEMKNINSTKASAIIGSFCSFTKKKCPL